MQRNVDLFIQQYKKCKYLYRVSQDDISSSVVELTLPTAPARASARAVSTALGRTSAGDVVKVVAEIVEVSDAAGKRPPACNMPPPPVRVGVLYRESSSPSFKHLDG